MKKIIDGKTYNTETAILIGRYRSVVGRSDFRHIDEGLYITKRGNFFLAGEGGPMTRYAYSCGDSTYCGGEGIVPIGKREALEWCERCDTDEDTWSQFFEIEEA